MNLNHEDSRSFNAQNRQSSVYNDSAIDRTHQQALGDKDYNSKCVSNSRHLQAWRAYHMCDRLGKKILELREADSYGRCTQAGVKHFGES